jgi:ribonuclease HI
LGWCLWAFCEKKAQLFSRKVCYRFFQTEIYAILACAHEIKSHVRPEKYVSIWSDSQADLRVLQAVRTTSLSVQQCQKALIDIYTRHAVGLYWAPGRAGVRGNEIADELARCGSA